MTQRSLRAVIFSPSIVSDVENPQATIVRAICQALVDLGCDVTHLEERDNPWMRALLETQGAEPLRAFNRVHPLIRYRTYSMLAGMERSVWFGRELATADLCIVFPGSPQQVLDEIAGFEVRQVVRIWDSPECDLPETRNLVFRTSEVDVRERAGQLIADVNAELSRRQRS